MVRLSLQSTSYLAKKYLLLAIFAQMTMISSGLSQAQTAATVPHVIRFSGTARNVDGEPLTGVLGLTFALYAEQTGGPALWMETQNVRADASGRYTVLLGSTKPDGLPAELFASEQARWIGVQIAEQAELPRALLVSAPYALKAGDAETLGGLPPSAFMLSAPVAAGSGESSPITSSEASAANGGTASLPASSNVTTTGGTANTIPMFTTATNIQNSLLTQTGTTAVNVAGKLNQPATGTATTAKGFNSQPHDLVASVFSSSSKAAVAQTFQLQAEPINNNKSTASGTLNLLYGSGTSTPAETGLSFSNKGLITFTTGQTFPGVGTITGITTASGSGLTGGGTSGALNLSLTQSCVSGQTLAWSGTAWACQTPKGGGTVTSVALSAPSSDFTVTGSPVTSSGTLGLNWTIAPTSNNTANTIVKRDSSGDFGANLLNALTISTNNAFVSGKVAIGTSSPRDLVDVWGGAVQVTGSDHNGTAYVSSKAGTAYFSNNTIANGIAVTPTGTVGIGTGTPQAELNLNAGGNANADSLLIGNNTSKGLQLRDTGSGVDLESLGVPLYLNAATQQYVIFNPNGGTVYIGPGATGDTSAGTFPLVVGSIHDSVDGNWYSAYFANDVLVGSDLFVYGSKNFRIDHPLDPTNKYLKHAAIESSEVLNQYSGNVVLDARGEARVEFPAWFGAINTDFRYQLTAIGAPGPSLYVAEEVKDNAFKIAGGTPGMKVSWQVSAQRNDPYMRAHPYTVEENKPESERGFYTHPELYGAPKEQGIFSKGQVTAEK